MTPTADKLIQPLTALFTTYILLFLAEFFTDYSLVITGVGFLIIALILYRLRTVNRSLSIAAILHGVTGILLFANAVWVMLSIQLPWFAYITSLFHILSSAFLIQGLASLSLTELRIPRYSTLFQRWLIVFILVYGISMLSNTMPILALFSAITTTIYDLCWLIILYQFRHALTLLPVEKK